MASWAELADLKGRVEHTLHKAGGSAEDKVYYLAYICLSLKSYTPEKVQPRLTDNIPFSTLFIAPSPRQFP